ncbi:hypothetical protein PL11201_680021 [Planktothrix sp. PCC 11201]|nr:hypothetical protein PL11201_680021 [Planktothrix sp. PCC 11201]
MNILAMNRQPESKPNVVIWFIERLLVDNSHDLFPSINKRWSPEGLTTG